MGIGFIVNWNHINNNNTSLIFRLTKQSSGIEIGDCNEEQDQNTEAGKL
jgi:hypothetical protein